MATLLTLVLGLLLETFYATIPQESPKENMISHLGGFWNFLPRYLRFIVLEFFFLLLTIPIALKNNKYFEDWKLLFWVLGICLFLWPLYYYGIFSDFSMRASLPSLFLLFFFVLWCLAQNHLRPKTSIFLTILILVGSFSFISDMYRGIIKLGEIYPPSSMDTFLKDIVFQYLGDPAKHFFKNFF